MRDLGVDLAAHVEQEVTTLCFCWKVTRSDGTSLGFTNHDRDITFDSLTYEAATGFSASSMKASDDLSVDDMDASGMLVSDKLDEQDLQNGLYDNAQIEIWLVNWEDVTQRSLERFGSIGEVTRSGEKFKTEIRGYTYILQQPFGRLFQRTCQYIVGDSDCTIDLDQSQFKGSGTVATVESRATFNVSGLGAFTDGWFTKGVLTWTTGNNTGKRIDVRQDAISGSDRTIRLLYSMGMDVQVGDTFDITAGCDKDINTCIDKFNNVDNFGGFPFMPGNDFVVSYPTRGQGSGNQPIVQGTGGSS